MTRFSRKTKKTIFVWSGTGQTQRQIYGEIEAANLRTAGLLLRRNGIAIKSIERKPPPISLFGKTVSTRDVVFLTRQLATMLESGIPVSNALEGIREGHENANVKALIDDIRANVESGNSLSQTLKKHRVFNNLYISLVNAGEQSGTLDILMEKIAAYLEKMERIKNKIRAALFYPALIILVSVSVVSVILLFVIPQFESLFADYGADLPALTRGVVNLSHSIDRYWAHCLAGIFISGVTLRYFYRNSIKMKYFVDRLVLSIPVFGPIIRKAIIARLARTLATMFGAGIPLIDLLETAAGTAGNSLYNHAMAKIRCDVAAGQRLGVSMAGTGLFPGMVLQMVATGEESGKLQHMLHKVAEFYENDVDTAVDTMSSLIEPFLITILGIIVGAIVTAMYLPIFKISSLL